MSQRQQVLGRDGCAGVVDAAALPIARMLWDRDGVLIAAKGYHPWAWNETTDFARQAYLAMAKGQI